MVAVRVGPVTVPAGTFTCVRVRRSRQHHRALVCPYAKGLGLVKQRSARRPVAER